MSFITEQLIYGAILLGGFILGLVAASLIIGHNHHCLNKCAIEGCMRDGYVRVWSDSFHGVVYICDKDSGSSLFKRGLHKAKELT